MNKSILIKGVAVSVLASFVATTAMAEAGTYKVRVGISNVDPKSDNGILAGAQADVKDDTTLTFNAVYMINDNVGVELLAALPFEHDIALNGGKVGSTKHLPPTLSGQYYFNNDSIFTPYLGLGLNYTLFFNDKAEGALAGSELSLDSSFGLAYQAGVDIDVNEEWFLNVDYRKIDIDSDVKVDGAKVGEANIDPSVVSINVGYKF